MGWVLCFKQVKARAINVYRLDAISTALASGIDRDKSDNDGQGERKNHSLPNNEGLHFIFF